MIREPKYDSFPRPKLLSEKVGICLVYINRWSEALSELMTPQTPPPLTAIFSERKR